jgi:hypothetical protein
MSIESAVRTEESRELRATLLYFARCEGFTGPGWLA